MVIGLLAELVHDVRFFDERHFGCGCVVSGVMLLLHDQFTVLFLARTFRIDFDIVFR
jgi:hypothetical protein